jgi:hypothetical protein
MGAPPGARYQPKKGWNAPYREKSGQVLVRTPAKTTAKGAAKNN